METIVATTAPDCCPIAAYILIGLASVSMLLLLDGLLSFLPGEEGSVIEEFAGWMAKGGVWWKIPTVAIGFFLGWMGICVLLTAICLARMIWFFVRMFYR